MDLCEQRRRLVEDLRLIEDPHERLSVVVDRGRHLPAFPAAERVAGNRVPGCVSATYLAKRASEGRCFFRIDSGSALVKGLAGCFCQLYEGRGPDEILDDPEGLIAEMGLDRMITPNRLSGIGEVRKAMRRFAHSVRSSVGEQKEDGE